MSAPLTQMMQERRPLILDGAMGTELQRRGADTGLPLWSASALITQPDVVLQIHRDYIEAGADIITTNTFRTTRRTFRHAGMPDQSGALTAKAVALAFQARELTPGKTILIAGSLAPLEDCYRPDLVPSSAELEDEHGELAHRLAEHGVDVLLLETMNSIREAVIACRQAVATGKETILSFLCTKEGALYSGEPLEEAIAAVAGLFPTALSVNCVSPHFIGNAIARLQRSTELPFAVYANVGLPEHERGTLFLTDVREEEYIRHARRWHDAGASIIGGCCGTTPEYIRALTRTFFHRSPVETPL